MTYPRRDFTTHGVLICLAWLCTCPAQANRLANGSFEAWARGAPVGWHWFRKDGAPPDAADPTPVGFAADTSRVYTGTRSIRFWKKSPIERERYGMLFQDVKDLPAGATLHLRAMLKGRNVGRTYWADWKHLVIGPTGDFDWRRLSATIQLPPTVTAMRFMIAIDDATEDLWVDDVQLIVAGESFTQDAASAKAHEATPSAKAEYVVLGSFERLSDGWYSHAFGPWTMSQQGDARVSFMRDAGDSAHGVHSLRISKQAPAAPAVYGMLAQKITGLPPGAMIHYSAMLKGEGVDRVWLGGRATGTRLPDGDFDWQRFEGRATLSDVQTEFTLRVGVDGRTTALWVDDVHVWVDDRARPQRRQRLFIRRMQPPARPGVATIKGTIPFPETRTGFQIIVRNVDSRTRSFALHWTLCDALGDPLRRETIEMVLASQMQTRVTVPVDLAERRVAALLATLRDDAGRDLDQALDFVTAAPASLEPVPLSRRFGACAFPFLWSDETSALALDQLAAGGYGDWRYSQMDRSFDSRKEQLDPEACRRLFTEARSRGISILPILGFSPTWAVTAPPGASPREKRMLLPHLDVWSSLVRQYVAAHAFKAVEVWNEPDGSAPLGYPKHQAYARLLNATYDAVKSVDPDIMVVGCSTQGEGTGWPESVLKAGGRMDAISFHPYRSYVGDAYRCPSIEKRLGERAAYPDVIASLNAMSARYNDGTPLPLYATEIGFMEYHADGTPRVHGMHLYKTQYLIRSFLTLAGLGVQSTHAFVYGMTHGGTGYGLGQRPDFSLRPDWWATRTLQEVAAPRKIGVFTPLADDVFALPMTGDTNAVAVWTAEDACLVGTTTALGAVRDLFGRRVAPVSTEYGHVYVIPAGSVIYAIGAGLTAGDVEPLARLTRDRWQVTAGGTVEYRVEPTKASAAYFSADLPGRVSVDFDPAMTRWAAGAAALPLGDTVARVPVIVPVRSKLAISLAYDERCHPQVRIENNQPEAVKARIEIRAGDRATRATPTIAAGALHTETLSRLPRSPSRPMDVSAHVVIGAQSIRLARALYHAPVARAAVTVDGDVADWGRVERIALSEWFRNAAARPADPSDLSASMAMAYDAEHFYVLVEVTDDVHYEPFAAGQAWMGDSIQLAFDTNPTGEHNRAEMDFALSDTGDPIKTLRPLNTIDVAEVRFRVRRRGTRTIYELAFPLAALNVRRRGPGTRLGFSLLVNENDTGAREGYLRWSDGIGNGKDPEAYGQLVFCD